MSRLDRILDGPQSRIGRALGHAAITLLNGIGWIVAIALCLLMLYGLLVVGLGPGLDTR